VSQKRKTKKHGVVQKIIKQPHQPEKAEIAIQDADHLYREIRIENKLHGSEPAKLKQGAPVEVTIEAEEKDTVPVSGEQSEQGTAPRDKAKEP
jgi:hypothetical protein